ncbi:MAG: hypothetical protein E7425_01075 [Ruminococcaceae bacterium]|nr:hypothetical protein [Oscillospiraceae bacterium]
MKNNPGEWQEERNQWGGVRRFRMNGKIKEYEPTIDIDGVEIPESELEDYHRRKHEQTAARIEQSRQAALSSKTYACPFRGGGNNCKGASCAIFTGDRCALAQIAATATGDTQGKACPFSPYKCRVDCELYKNGCVLTAIKERI